MSSSNWKLFLETVRAQRNMPQTTRSERITVSSIANTLQELAARVSRDNCLTDDEVVGLFFTPAALTFLIESGRYRFEFWLCVQAALIHADALPVTLPAAQEGMQELGTARDILPKLETAWRDGLRILAQHEQSGCSGCEHCGAE